jgi:hypothetical protein
MGLEIVNMQRPTASSAINTLSIVASGVLMALYMRRLAGVRTAAHFSAACL